MAWNQPNQHLHSELPPPRQILPQPATSLPAIREQRFHQAHTVGRLTDLFRHTHLKHPQTRFSRSQSE